MLEKTIDYIKCNSLLRETDKILLAVSGGIDSMVMLHLFRQLNYSISVAHCNFSLRGKESDNDQKFIEDYCSSNNIKLFVRTFNTMQYAEQNGLSVQMAARDLRYSWFEEVRSANKLDSILLGHNQDDIIETFFINLVRGTGLRGLTGIKPSNGNLTRPLLFASRKDIEKYASDNNITFREDSSNTETKYKRNSIRHKIIPLFKELNPSFSSSMELTIMRLEEVQKVIDKNTKIARDRIFVNNNSDISVKINDLLVLEPSDLYYYELFKDFGIGANGIDELKKLIAAPPGKQISTKTHTILKDREELLISGISIHNQDISETMVIDKIQDIGRYKLKVVDAADLTISGDPNTAYLDYDKIKLPLNIRKWAEGDYFYPLGMKGKKKLSDFFVDLKIPLNKKNDINIFLSDEKIFWVAGYRIDNRFCITDLTSRVLVISEMA